MAYSPNGKTVLTGSWDSTARLWDVPESKPPEILLQHTDPVFAAAFSPDGSMVATASFSANANRTQDDPAPTSKARLWDARTGKPLGDPLPPQPHQEWPRKVAFSPDGKTFAMLSEYWDFKRGRECSVIHLWDVATRQALGQPMVQMVDAGDWAAGLERLAFAADGKTLSATDRQGLIQLWDVATGQPIGAPEKVDSSMTHPQAFSPDGQRVLSGQGYDNTAILRNAVKGEKDRNNAHARTMDGYVVIGQLQHQGSVEAVAFGPDVALLLTGSDDKTARLWDAATLKPIGPPLKHEGPVRSVAFNPDGQTVLTASLDKTVRLWQVPSVAEGETKRLVLWPEVTTGMQLFGGAPHVLNPEEWLKRKDELENLGGPPLP